MKKRQSLSSWFLPKLANARGGSIAATYGGNNRDDSAIDIRKSGHSLPTIRNDREEEKRKKELRDGKPTDVSINERREIDKLRRKGLGYGNKVQGRREKLDGGADATGKRVNFVPIKEGDASKDGGRVRESQKRDGDAHQIIFRGEEDDVPLRIPSAQKTKGAAVVKNVHGQMFDGKKSIEAAPLLARKGDAHAVKENRRPHELISCPESMPHNHHHVPVSEHQKTSRQSRLAPKLLRDFPDFSFSVTPPSSSSCICFQGHSIHGDYGELSSTFDCESLPSTTPYDPCMSRSILSNSTSIPELGHVPRNVNHYCNSNEAAAEFKDVDLAQGHSQADDEQTRLFFRMSKLMLSLKSQDVEVQRDALMELRLLAKYEDDKRIAIFEAGALPSLLALLGSKDEICQREATTTLLNLSLNPTVKAKIAESGTAFHPLVSIIRQGLTLTAMANATIALFNLMGKDDEAKTKVGDMGVILPLLELLNNESERARKDAATALYSLSSIDSNKRKMVRAGATRVLLDLVSDDAIRSGMVEKSIAILRSLVCIEEGRVAFVAEGGLNLLQQTIQKGSQRGKELSLDVLLIICRHSSKHRTLVLRMDMLPSLLSLNRTPDSPLKLPRISEVIDILEEHKMSLLKQSLNHSLP